jgi:hypothetical protein
MDFQTLVAKLIERLHAWGHAIKNLLPLFLQAAAILESHAASRHRPDSQAQNVLYNHWTHHPKGMQCSDICQIYNHTLKPHNTHVKMIITISCPKNFRDILTKTALKLPEGTHIQDLIKEQTINT